MPLTPETAAAGEPMLPWPYRVESVARETPDTFTLEIEPRQEAAQAPYTPGQFSMLYMPGVGELPISISGNPERARRLVFTVRRVGAATAALVGLGRGDWLGVRGPFGTPWPVEQARGKDVLLVAGGIGLAPLRPVIYHVLQHRDDYVRLIILYGTRSAEDVLFRKELAAWARSPDAQVLTTVDHGTGNWRGRVGVVTTLFRHVRLHPDRTVAMMCGPEIMMRRVAEELELVRGVPADQIYMSMERNMKCAIGFCGHCQWGPHFICKDGPVFPYHRIRGLLRKREL